MTPLPRHLRRCPLGVPTHEFLAELERYARHHDVTDDEYLAAVESAQPKRPRPELPLFRE